MKNKQNPVKFILILICFLAVAGAVFFAIRRVMPTKEKMDLRSYYNMTNEDDIALITDDGVSQTNGKIIDGEIFLPYETVSNDISGSIFYDKDTGTIIVTTATEKLRFDASNEIRVVDDIIYVTLGLVVDYSNAVITQYEDPARIVVRSGQTYNAEHAAENTYVRYAPDLKSKVLTGISEGNVIRVIDVNPDGTAGTDKAEGWTMVQTEDGLRGYVEDESLDGNVVSRQDEIEEKLGSYTHILHEGSVNMLYHQVSSVTSGDLLTKSVANVTGVNVIAPTWFFLDSVEGDQTSLVDASYVTAAHSLGMQVWAVMNDFDGKVNDNTATMQALASDAVREKLVFDTVSQVLSVGADGINIDYEKVTEECAPYFLQFIREMSVGCRNAGLILSVSEYVPTYTGYLNRREQARVADYVVCMCYDEHTTGSEEAGSVSSLSFVENGIKNTLREVPRAQTIIAIPFFTRLWMTTSQDAPDSQALGMDSAMEWVAKNNLDINWDNEAAQNYVEMQGDSTYYQMWLEDAASVEEKMKLIESYGCGGVAEWKLGLGTSDVWSVIASHLR